MDPRHQLGRLGEEEALAFLQAQGLRLHERNVRTPLGELDLIVRDKDVWVFVEVKKRSSAGAFTALDAISPRKQRHLIHSTLYYAQRHRLLGQPMRLDIVTLEAGRIEWYPNALELPSHFSV